MTLEEFSSRPVRNSNQANAGITIRLNTAIPMPTLITRLTSFMPRTFMPRAYEEIRGMTDPVLSSDLDWTIVRFIAPKDTAKTGKPRIGLFGTDKIGFAVSRADIAAFTAAQADDDTYHRRAPAIST